MPETLTNHRTEVLALTARYGLLTPAAANALLYAGTAPDTAKRLLLRTKNAGLLGSFAIGPRVVYQLSPAGARAIGASSYLTRPPGALALRERLAVLSFCMQKPPCQKLSCRELNELLPDLKARPTQHYAFDFDTGTLYRLTLDCQSSADYLLTKAVKIGRAARQGPLEALLHEGKFVIALLTGYPPKAERIRALCLRNHVTLPIEGIVLEEMTHV